MKHYLLNIYQPQGSTPPADALTRIMADVNACIEEVKAAGAWVFNGGLTPASSATVLRHQDGVPLLTDGPYAEGKEQIGGLLVIRASDLDAALRWAERLSRATTLPIEVRPFHGDE